MQIPTVENISDTWLQDFLNFDLNCANLAVCVFDFQKARGHTTYLGKALNFSQTFPSMGSWKCAGAFAPELVMKNEVVQPIASDERKYVHLQVEVDDGLRECFIESTPLDYENFPVTLARWMHVVEKEHGVAAKDCGTLLLKGGEYPLLVERYISFAAPPTYDEMIENYMLLTADECGDLCDGDPAKVKLWIFQLEVKEAA